MLRENSVKDSFSKLNPFVLLVFFISAIGFSMFIDEPICLVLSFFSALLSCIQINKKHTLRLCFIYILPLSLIFMIINPLFNHQGVTILAYFPWGNPLTLESIIYGIVPSAVLASAILWFSVFNTVMTSDKLMYLFGKAAPSLSLVISMALRFVPKFTQELKSVRKAQKCIGRDLSSASTRNSCRKLHIHKASLPERFRQVSHKVKNAVKIISIVISRSMEEAVETADSMKSRGYGLKGRIAYSIYRFRQRDIAVLTAIVLLSGAMLCFAIFGCFEFYYFPAISFKGRSTAAVFGYITYACLLILPLILNIEEGLRWKLSRSKI